MSLCLDAHPGLENRDQSWNRQDRRRPVRESLRVDTLPENLTHVVVRRLSFSLDILPSHGREVL